MRLTINEAKSRFDELVDLAYEGGEEIIIRKDENRGVAIISLDEYESLKETIYLLSSDKNRDRLLKSLADSKAGKVFEIKIEDL